MQQWGLGSSAKDVGLNKYLHGVFGHCGFCVSKDVILSTPCPYVLPWYDWVR